MSFEDTGHENLLLVQHLPMPYRHTLSTEMGTQSPVPGEPAAGPVLTEPLWEQGRRGQQVTAVAVSGRNANLLWLLYLFFCFCFFVLTTANANFQDLNFLLLQQSSKRKHSSFFYTIIWNDFQKPLKPLIYRVLLKDFHKRPPEWGHNPHGGDCPE